jgi:hypothetical protein
MNSYIFRQTGGDFQECKIQEFYIPEEGHMVGRNM